MFKKIEELHDHKTNEGFYPLTHVQAVIDNDEIDLETKLNQINNDISTKVTDYSKQYLTTVARENGTISFVISSGINTNLLTSISYSTDGGNTWITTNNTDNKEENVQIDVNVNGGDKVMWKGLGLALSDISEDSVSSFVTNIPIDVEGNIMSLLYGDNFIGQTSLSNVGSNFYELFANDINSGADVIGAKNLILLATILASYCYSNMFQGCTALIKGPELSATRLADGCYWNMFNGCTSLTQAPALPATVLAVYCYNAMFQGCTALTQAPTLPATSLDNYCYYYMFKGCTSLTQAPALPATTLASNCYREMFYGCTSLTQAPTLPATTLASNCYREMFYGCTSLTQAPTLPATTLASTCYYMMFKGCTKLTSVTCLATDISASASTSDWLYNVAATGTFITADNPPTWSRNSGGIPNGWTVVNYTTPARYLTFRGESDNSSFGLKRIATGHKIYYSRDLQYWKLLNTEENIAINNGEKVYIIGDANGVTFKVGNKTTFRMGGSVSVTGDITSILDYATLNEKIAPLCYFGMFWGCTSLTQAPELPVTTLADDCYRDMFNGCTSLTQAPELPATTLANSCYSSMFFGCTSLTQAPTLPATTLASTCYYMMFKGCTSLTQTPALPATTLANSCYSGMFSNCTSLTQTPALPATSLADSCYRDMFSGCRSLTQAPALPATTLANDCYLEMFYGCTALTQAPELPATTLADYCYYWMFYGCTALTQAPELPATTLADYCYYQMFKNCTNLSSITCLATDVSATDSTANWLSGVASTGTFAKPTSMTSWTNGISGIPNGWTVVDCIATTPARYLTFRAESNNSSFGLKTIATNHKVYYSRDLQYWKLFDTEEDIAINDDEEVYVIGDADSVTFASNNTTTFRMSGAISVTGDITSILNYKTLTEKIAPYCYYCMFDGCTSLTQAPTLPATTLAEVCYWCMFRGCTSLTQAPTLPATTLANNCYLEMFYGCTSLTQAPELPATTLAYSCYDAMFRGCTSLTQARALPATRLTGGCYANMFYGCTSLIQAPALSATVLAPNCYSSMFVNCTSLTQAPELPATTLASQCYQSMFEGCTSLTQAPELPANTLAEYCYQSMFNGCTNLSFVICLATNISATNSTTDWLSSVATTGTFIMADNSPASWSRNGNGIPSGWNAYTESGYEVVRHQELDINISITPFISKQQKINNKSINQILIPIDSSKNNYSGDNLSDTTIITYISDNENYLVLELGNVIEENYVIIEANLIGQGFYSNANILYNNGVVQIYSALPLNSIKDNLEYLFISYYISDTSGCGCGCGCGTTPDSPDPTPTSSE